MEPGNLLCWAVKEVVMSKKRELLTGIMLLLVALLGGCFLLSNRPPEAAFVIVYDVDAGDPLIVDLDASASIDPDGDSIVSYWWIFGEDVTILTPLEVTKFVTIPVIRVRYPFEGAYTVKLRVGDDQVENSVSEQVSKTIVLPNVPVAPTS